MLVGFSDRVVKIAQPIYHQKLALKTHIVLQISWKTRGKKKVNDMFEEISKEKTIYTLNVDLTFRMPIFS